MSIVPYRGTRNRRERRPLDRPQIVRAALALLDEVGLDGLTMRSLAERLGIQAASLYRHVQDKEELLVLLADEISGELPAVEIPVKAHDRPEQEWQGQLVDLARRYRRVLLAHRDGARLFASTRPAGPNRLRHIDALFGLLLSAGFPPQEAMRAGYHFNNFVTESVADEVRMSLAAETMGTSQSEAVAEAREQLRSLPANEYPNLTRFAEYVVDDDAEGLFQFGLDLWIGGLERLSRL
ncbi:MAG: TetR/AcrR family transcriptional regulator C-terminal domain-containing protein [Chloroflexia bacterium]